MLTLVNYEIAIQRADDELRRSQSQSIVRAAKRESRVGRLAGIRAEFGAALIAAGQWVQGAAEARPRPAAVTPRG